MRAARPSLAFAAPLALLILAGCASTRIVDPVPGKDWGPILSEGQIATVRQTFSRFEPELYKPGTDPTNRLGLTPSNFSPAQFFGPARPQGSKLTPAGVRVETNGYDLPDISSPLADSGTYFHPDLAPYTIKLGPTSRSPLDELQDRMRISETHNGPVVEWDRRNGRLNPAEVDTLLTAVRDSVAREFPPAADVPISTCSVVMQPTIFFVKGSSSGDTWAGGLTHDDTELHVLYFYINGDGQMLDWHNFLISEGLNCFLIVTGHRGLAR